LEGEGFQRFKVHQQNLALSSGLGVSASCESDVLDGYDFG
jgi:hypothetical protein